MRKQIPYGLILRGLSLIAPLCLASCLYAQLWSGIISSPRASDWSIAGVPGGIPARTTICTTLNPGATAAQITSALQACPSGQTVYLSAGTYNLSTGISFPSNVTLRGAGANQTFLVFSGNTACQGLYADLCFASTDANYWGAPTNLANWTAGYAVGTTSLTLSSVTNLKVGSPVTLDQADDTTDSGDVYVCYVSQGVCSANGDNGGFLRTGRSQEQLVTVTSISGSGPYTVGISPGLYMPNWASAKTPQAWWATSPVYSSGVENMSLNHTASAPMWGVGMLNCSGCWVKGVTSIDPARAHIALWQSPRCTVQDSYFFQTNNQTSESYGIETPNASDSLIQNNIFQQISGPLVASGTCSGCVWAYNFDIDDVFNSGGSYTWQQQGEFPHSVGDDHILLEGNQGVGLYSDNFHGTHHFMTAFRNNFDGFQPNNGTTTVSGIGPLLLNAFSRFYNIVGNVLGTTAFSYAYQCTITSCPASNAAIYEIGIGDEVPNDTNTQRTLMRWGNYDTATATVHWCGNSSNAAWATTCSSTSEIPSTIANYANSVPASTVLPASFYLSAEPTWWPSSKPWPPIGPDVSGGNMSGLGGHAYTIPAADCYANVMKGSANGTGPLLSFNASTCYGTSSVTTTPPTLPSPPTSLSAVAH
jgi:hypothetical protein